LFERLNFENQWTLGVLVEQGEPVLWPQLNETRSKAFPLDNERTSAFYSNPIASASMSLHSCENIFDASLNVSG